MKWSIDTDLTMVLYAKPYTKPNTVASNKKVIHTGPDIERMG